MKVGLYKDDWMFVLNLLIQMEEIEPETEEELEFLARLHDINADLILQVSEGLYRSIQEGDYENL